MLLRCLPLIMLTFLSSIGFAQSEKPYVLLISFDGFRHDYVDQFKLETFKKFGISGAVAEGLIPSFPSKTFPNHYTIVTGLYPGNHGLVDNYFYDPVAGRQYNMRDRKAVTDKNFYQGTPFWSYCKQYGIKSASYFWIGSEVQDVRDQPDYFLPYDQSVPNQNRVEKVMEWLRMPEADRPRFITLYFSSPDTESHKSGPFSNETIRAVHSLDTLLSDLIEGVHAINLPVNIFIVSDHGMSELIHNEQHYVFINDFISPQKGIRVINGGTQAHVYVESQATRDSLYNALKPSKAFAILKQEEFPSEWHYNNPRTGDLLIIARENTYLVSGAHEKVMRERPLESKFGVHGYDPAKNREMLGIFYASGPNIKAGVTLKPFENVHLFPAFCEIFGIPVPENIDGKAEALHAILK